MASVLSTINTVLYMPIVIYIPALALSQGVTGGAIVALFSFGMFYPRGNYKGVLAGSIASLLIMAWIVFGSQKAIMEGRLKHQTLPTTAEGCGYNDTSEELPV
ncbi:hypothetical protein C0J52_02932 [Blattella germanica]|nr:hypothetical protein C0J52_02932 [Blattella germanica]